MLVVPVPKYETRLTGTGILWEQCNRTEHEIELHRAIALASDQGRVVLSYVKMADTDEPLASTWTELYGANGWRLLRPESRSRPWLAFLDP